jgi:hypothetical protein
MTAFKPWALHSGQIENVAFPPIVAVHLAELNTTLSRCPLTAAILALKILSANPEQGRECRSWVNRAPHRGLGSSPDQVSLRPTRSHTAV